MPFMGYICKSLPGQRIGLTLTLAGAIALSHHSVVSAQTAITGLRGGYESGLKRNYSTTTANPCQSPYTTCGKPINMQFGVGATNDYRATGFTSGAGNYSLVNLADAIKFRRINGQGATGERQLMLFERDTTDATGARIRSSYVNSMEAGLLSNIANRGIDNAFSNDNSVASNNLERIDYIISNGLDVPTDVRNDVGFLILERGGNDPFKIAAITSLDANGNPASFAPLRNVADTTWGQKGPNIQTSVMRREENEPNFRPSHTVPSQVISGIYISLSDLNVPAEQTIYGYALFPNDITATSSNDLVNLTGFPTNTSGASGQGGLDLMAGGGIYLADNLHVVSGTLYEDANGDNGFNSGEVTLPNGIEVILYRDTNGDGNYNSGVDERVQTSGTAQGNGGYNFIGVADGTYRVFVNTNDPDIPSNLLLGTPNNTQVVVSGSDRTAINFGFDTRTYDYGDAPVSYDDTADNNNLINANDNPARHAIAPNLYLGSIAPDAEAAPQSSTNANGDDNATAPNIDDEDAFTNLPNVTATATATGNYSLNVPVTNTSGGNARLHGWVDFNNNDKFESGEYQSVTVSNGDTTANLTWAVPAGTTPGDTHARFRLTTDTSLTDDGNTEIDERSIGQVNDGEVEDYPVTIIPAPLYDYGDAPDNDPGTGTGNYQTTANDGGAAQVVIDAGGQFLSIGNSIDIDDGSLQNSNADADDTIGRTPDDEDGVSSFPTLTTTEGQTYTVTVTARNNVPAVPAYLVGFIDFNKDGDFLDEGEQSNTVTVASDANPTGTSGELRTFNVTFTTPAGMTPGDTYARFRLGQVQATAEQATGASAGTDNGEVEDYQIAIAPSNYACPTAIADLWFANDESGSVSPAEFNNALDFLYQISDEFIYDDVTGIKAGVTAWANIVNSIEVVIPITESFGDPGDSGLISTTITTDGDGQGLRELYDSRQNTNTGTRLDYATNYLADLIIAGNGRRANTPQIAVILTDAFDLQLSEPGRGGGSNWITEADRLRTAGPDGTRIILIIIEEAADAYNNNADARATIDAVVGDGQLLVVPTYADAANATKGYVDAVSQAVCNATAPVASDPNLLLVKRITAINPGQSDEIQFNSFVNDDSNNDGDPNNDPDNDSNWPEGDNTYLRGAVNIGPEVAVVEPGDEVEYTIYFLSNGDEEASNVQICDVIPDNMSLVKSAYGVELSMALGLNETTLPTEPNINLSNAADTDEGTFYAPGTAPPTVGNPAVNLCQKVDTAGNTVSVGANENINGAIVVEIDSLPEATAPGTPANSYGFIRFRAKVK